MTGTEKGVGRTSLLLSLPPIIGRVVNIRGEGVWKQRWSSEDLGVDSRCGCRWLRVKMAGLVAEKTWWEEWPTARCNLNVFLHKRVRQGFGELIGDVYNNSFYISLKLCSLIFAFKWALIFSVIPYCVQRRNYML